jgi:formylglycine-generating enzyme required for sulfatase activity
MQLIIHRQKRQAQYYTEDLGDGVELDMMLIPGGKFLMGTQAEEIARLCKEYDVDYFQRESLQHKVEVSPFFMGKYLITQAQWRIVAGWKQIKRELNPDPSYFKKPYQDHDRWTRPVERISWHDAQEFCARLSKKTKRTYRLPTEAEWEYACKSVISYQLSVISEESIQNPSPPTPPLEGGKSKIQNSSYPPFHFGETITTDLANYRGTDDESGRWKGSYGKGPKGEYREQTTPVGYFQVANAFGLYDMHGNLWEWCEDDWHNNYEQEPPTDGSAWLSKERSSTKVVRGGSWNYLPSYCRSAYRSYFFPVNDHNDLGLRVVCAAPRTR